MTVMISSTPLYPPMRSSLARSARLPLALLLGAFVLWGVANATVMPHDVGLSCPLDSGRGAMGGTEAGYAAHNGAIVSISETRLVAGTLRMANATIHGGKTAAAHIDIAVAAPGQALGTNAPLSPQGFVPSLHATLMRMGEVVLRGTRDFALADGHAVVTPLTRIAWLHNGTDDGLPAAGNFPGTPMRFHSRTGAQERDATQFGAGLDLRFKQESGWDFGVKAAYGLDLRAGNTGHVLFGGFEIRF
jgi:hypothetical protein